MAKRRRDDQSELRYFLDRSLGALQVPGLLRAAGFDLETLDEVYGSEAAQHVADQEWLRYAGENGLVVLKKDRKIRWRAPELVALSTGEVRAFVIPRGHLNAEAMAGLYIENRHRIEQRARKDGPYIYAVEPGRLRRVWPQ